MNNELLNNIITYMDNENIMIDQLNYILIDLGIPNYDINDILFSFYTTIDIPLTDEINHEMNDVVVTTENVDSMPILIITKDMNETCSICMIEMEENDEYISIECKHIYHKDCLRNYLTNYNHICPICRKEIGTPYYNITE